MSNVNENEPSRHVFNVVLSLEGRDREAARQELVRRLDRLQEAEYVSGYGFPASAQDLMLSALRFPS